MTSRTNSSKGSVTEEVAFENTPQGNATRCSPNSDNCLVHCARSSLAHVTYRNSCRFLLLSMTSSDRTASDSIDSRATATCGTSVRQPTTHDLALAEHLSSANGSQTQPLGNLCGCATTMGLLVIVDLSFGPSSRYFDQDRYNNDIFKYCTENGIY